MDEPAADTGWVGNDGTFGDMATAPEAVRTLTENKGFKGIEDLASAYSNLEGMKGAFSDPNAMHLPDAFSAEQLVTIHGKMGVPENNDGYSYTAPDGSDVNTALLDKFKGFASENKMSQDQFTGALDFYENMRTEAMAAQSESQSTAFESGSSALKEAWGEEFTDNMEKADKFSLQSGMADLFDKWGKENDPDAAKLMFELSKMTEEGKLPNAQAVITKSKQEQLGELTSNPAYTNNMHPDHKAVVDKVFKLASQG